ncbi:unnamed protein product [Rotaria sp. Silwood2]|nr:unnamed protein product [Rotaria sp. Silwood2]CAF2715536.1 unnamed protein product [Rotaria sp. Silwood2]CAF4070032.1 unnamed protein product [Rotaria sp. Silwood2]CAF4276224.1 unnamed protein product [Rotaria sp. Silwood2]
MSLLDRLPNEIIICIFAYLKPEDKFHSFFDYNERLRKLVKRYTTYSRLELEKDINRFSTLHSWYKHLDYIADGEAFYIIPLIGEQPRYSFDPRISDYIGIHWHFWAQDTVPIADERIQRIIQKYPIKLNPSFYPFASYAGLLTPGFKDFISRHYPCQFDILKTKLFNRSCTTDQEMLEINTDDVKNELKYIFDNEPKRLKGTILEAAECIWKELQQLEDVNILKMECNQ